MANSPSHRGTWAIAAVLGVLVFIVFGSLLGAQFVNYDDPDFVTNNPRVRAGLTGAGITWAFQSTFIYWQPLTWLSYMVDASVFGVSARGFHFTNLLLHALNVALLFVALERVTGARWRSAWVAALFAFHPLHVETVAWVSERKGVLSSFFFMLALVAYARYAARPDWKRFAPVALCYACGLMAKSMVITLPAVLLFLDVWPLNRIRGKPMAPDGPPSPGFGAANRFPQQPWSRVFLEKLVLLPLALGSAAVTVAAQSQGGHVWSGEYYTVGMRVSHVVVSYAAYVRKTVLPLDLAVFYPHPRTHAALVILGSLALLAVLTACLVWQARRRPVLLVGWLWFVVMLLPVIGFLQTGDQALADRYTYLPLIGLFLVAAWGWGELAKFLRAPAALAAGVPVVATVLCLWLAHGQAGHWQNTRLLFEHAVAITPDNYVAHAVLANESARLGRAADAERSYARSLELKPGYFEGQTALANLLTAQRRFPEAISNYVAALQVNSNYVDALNGLGNVLLVQERFTEAVVRFNRVVELQPDSVPALGRLAWLLATHREVSVRNGARALELAKRAAALTGHQDALVLNTLAAAYAETGDFESAVATAQRALQLARAARQEQVAGIIQKLIVLYQAKTAYRE